jgi:phosphoglycerol transferase
VRLARLRWPAAAFLLPIAGAALVLHLWDANLRVPFVVGGDAPVNLMLVKGLIDHGWFLTNSSVGAPHGQQLYDYPYEADNLNFVLLRLLTLGSSDAGLVVNTYFLLGFGLMGLSAFLVLRTYIRPALALVFGTIFALTPFHLEYSEQHLFLTAAYSVPAGCFLALSLARGRHAYLRRFRPREFDRRTAVLSLALCIVVGSAGSYYAAFTLILLAALAVGTALATWRAEPLASGAALAATILVVLGFNALPTVIYQHQHGSNPAAVQRAPADAEVYGLKVSRLLLPVPDHRIGALAQARARYDLSSTTEGSATAPLGTVGSIGFLLGVLVLPALALLAGRQSSLLQRAGPAVLALLVVTLISIDGGLSAILAHYVTDDIRVYSRAVVILGFLSFLVLGVALDEGWTAHGRRLRSVPFAGAAAAALLLIVGVLDETSSANVPAYEANGSQVARDRGFVRQVEATVPRGSMIYQVPYVAFPEPTTVPPTISPYDAAFGYLGSRHLRWSWGAMKGRPADVGAELNGQPPDVVLKAIAAAGFAGVTLDRALLPDPGFQEEATKLLGQPTIGTADGRRLFYPLARLQRRQEALPAAARSALRRALLQPVGLIVEPIDIAVDNTGPDRAVVVHGTLPAGATLQVGSTRVSRAGAFRLRLRVPHGRSQIPVTASQPVPDLAAEDAAFAAVSART